MNEDIFKFEYPFNKELLFKVFNKIKGQNPLGNAYDYFKNNEDKITKKSLGFSVFHLKLQQNQTPHLMEHINCFLEWLDVLEHPSFEYLQLSPNTRLGWHADDCLASINQILTPSKAPIEFEQGTYHYTTALLNVKNRHCVENDAIERVLFRMSFRKVDFHQLKQKLEAAN